MWHRSFLLAEQWWRDATHDVPGATRHHEDVVAFAARQLLDMLAPANFPLTNPEVLQRAALTGDASLVRAPAMHSTMPAAPPAVDPSQARSASRSA